jgi:signal transduction histidine kinase/CheY-like chemotaxis protein
LELPVNLKTEFDGVAYRLDRLSLEFTGLESNLETSFREDYFDRNLGHIRNCHLYTIFFYVVGGLIDWLLFPEYLLELFSIRFFLVAPVFIFGFIFSFTSLYRYWWQQISFFYILLTGGSFIAFILIVQTPDAHEYYVGMLFCMMFGYTFIRERFIYASAAGLLLVVGYFTVSVFVSKIPGHTALQSNFYLILANFLGMLIARHLEISARRDFYLEHRLSQEQAKAQALNEDLEHRVKTRTHDLEQSNALLRSKIDALHRSEAERTKLEAQLRQAYKMEAIGALAGGIAHDFNNILASTMGYTELALRKIEKGSDIEGHLREIYTASERARDLVRQILAFSRRSDEAPRPIQVGPIVKEVVRLLRSSIPSSIRIGQRLGSDAFTLGDPVNIHQILMNLATNASHAMEEGAVLEIATHDIILDEAAALRIGGLSPGDYIRVSVSDTGHGITPEIADMIFEPYFTTKAPGEGTGMGLAMVYGIVRKYKGTVTVESKPGEGAVFTVYLPATERRKPAKVPRQEELPTGSERILLVDDELAIAEMGGLILSDQGYRVTIRESSRSALELFRSDPGAFDLIVTDMTMPEMTGDKLAVAVMDIRPDIPVILYTGYSKNITEEKAKKIGIRAFANKPVGRAELIKIIRDVLDGAKDRTSYEATKPRG